MNKRYEDIERLRAQEYRDKDMKKTRSTRGTRGVKSIKGRNLRVALVHDYVKEFGGAERVLMTLSEMFPEAPIYTAFRVSNSTFARMLSGKKVIVSWANNLVRWGNLHSPSRFLTPLIWESFDFRGYDIVISSASWYITKSIRTTPATLHICYCHTPPRWLYGYATSVGLQKYLPVRIYGAIVGHFLRMYDYLAAQRVNEFVANSKNVQRRIWKFYRRNSTVIYPPVEVKKIEKATQGLTAEGFYLIVTRLVGGKGLDLAVEAAKRLSVPLKIIGEAFGFSKEKERLEKVGGGNVEMLGRLPDNEMWEYLGKCKAFLALATDEDFGVTPVEAMAAGRPVVAYAGGGYLETVVDGKTGVFFNEPTAESLEAAMRRLDTLVIKSEDCRRQARKFAKEVFVKRMNEFVRLKWREHCNRIVK